MDARRKFVEHERSVRVAQVNQFMNQFFYNMATTTWALKHVLFLTDVDYNLISSLDARRRKTKVFIIVTRRNQLSNS